MHFDVLKKSIEFEYTKAALNAQKFDNQKK